MRERRKARTLLLMAVPKDHLRRFHGMDDAKEIWAAIQDKESLEKGYDRFQKLLSQLDALGAGVSDEDANHKFLRLRSLQEEQAEGQGGWENCMWHLIREKVECFIATILGILFRELPSLKFNGSASTAGSRVNVNTGHGNVSSGRVYVNTGTQFKSGGSRFNTGHGNVNSG
ncbi:hypothetical protein Tco_0287007 [Tanacetum coccineum]